MRAELGGHRHKGIDESSNLGLENKGFHINADYMLTDEFWAGVEKLQEIAWQKRTAIMCAEVLFWRCHRRVSDFLAANDVRFQHIMPSGELTSLVQIDRPSRFDYLANSPFQPEGSGKPINSSWRSGMDATRPRRLRDSARQGWYARWRSVRFARHFGFPPTTAAPKPAVASPLRCAG